MKHTCTRKPGWLLGILFTVWTASAWAQCGPTPTNYTTIPYYTGFENGIDQYWNIVTVNGSEIDTFPAFLGTSWGSISPIEGTYMLGAHQPNGGSYAQNESWLRLDLCGRSQVYCDFSWAEWNDESETQDGVFFSDDGGSTFTKVLNLPGASYTDLTWQHFSLNVDSLCNVYNLNLTNTFVIKFQQYDNYYFNGGNDGHFYDSISVYSEVVGDTNVGVAALLAPDSVCGNTDDTLRIIVQNYGDSTLTNIPVEYSVNNGPYTSAGVVPGPLANGEADTLVVFGMPYTALGVYGVKARTVMPGDTLPQDDMDSTTVVNLQVPSAPMISGATTICLGDTLELMASGDPNSVFYWYEIPPNPPVFSGPVYEDVPSAPGTTTFSVVAEGANGCPSAPTAVVTQVTPPFNVSIAASSSVGLCPGDTLVLDAGAGYATYLWNFGLGNSTFDVTVPGNYWVTVRDNSGCIGTSDTVTVFSHPQAATPMVTAAPDDTVCQGDTIVLTSSLTGTLVWNDPASSTTPSIDVTTLGVYQVTYTDTNGCSSVSVPLWVGFHPLPNVTISGAFPLDACIGDSIDLSNLGFPAGGTWSGPDVSNNVFSPSAAGTVTLSYSFTNSTGCTGTETQSIPVIDCVTGVAELPGGMSIQVWPQPARDVLYVTFDLQNGTSGYTIYDLRGQEVARGSGLQGAGREEIRVDHLESGTYLIRFQGASLDHTVRWMKL